MRRGTVLALGAMAVGVVVGERVAARRIRDRVHPEADALLVPPADVVHLTVSARDGGSLHLLERGQGQPVLLVHGITLNAELWSPELHGLADEFRVLALDQRGHGRSTAGTDGYTIRQLGDDIAAVIEGLELHDVLLVGHSMGGMASLTFGTDHADLLAERVAGIGLVATSASSPVVPSLVPRAAALGAYLVQRLDNGRPIRRFRFSGNDLSLFLIRSVFGKDPSAAAIEQVRASIEQTDDDALLRLLGGILGDYDVVDHLAKVDVPSFVVVGRRDLLTPVPFARIMAEGLPGAELTILPDAGHQLMQERPEVVDQLVRDLAKRSEAAGRRGVGAAAPSVGG